MLNPLWHYQLTFTHFPTVDRKLGWNTFGSPLVFFRYDFITFKITFSFKAYRTTLFLPNFNHFQVTLLQSLKVLASVLQLHIFFLSMINLRYFNQKIDRTSSILTPLYFIDYLPHPISAVHSQWKSVNCHQPNSSTSVIFNSETSNSSHSSIL